VALRSLDSKYANIVSMVKDLGQVHKPIFPSPDDIAVDDDEEGCLSHPEHDVENWAKAVHDGQDGDHPESNEQADRQPRFDRPLSDIRVGESPTRPWGIKIPESFEANGKTASQQSDPTASPDEGVESKHTRSKNPDLSCPFHFVGSKPGIKAPPEIANATDERKQGIKTEKNKKGKSSPKSQVKKNPMQRIIFNGPVFFGYAADQAMAFLSHQE